MQKSFQGQPIMIGKAQFKPNINIKKLLQVQQIKKKLQNKKWQIRYKTYQLYHWQQIFKSMIWSLAQRIQLTGNQNPTIIKEIGDINFAQLKILWLSNNNIDNIQALCFLQCQQLQVLSLSLNRINLVKSMKKLKFDNMKILDFYKNNIIKVKVLERMNIIQIRIDYLVNPFNHFEQKLTNLPQIYQDLSLIFKLRCTWPRDIITNNLNFTNIKAQNGIYQSKLIEMMQKKFSSLQSSSEDSEERRVHEFGYKKLKKL